MNDGVGKSDTLDTIERTLHMVDKIVWSKLDPTYHHTSVLQGVGGYFYDKVPECSTFCAVTADWYTESLVTFIPACEANEWKLFDSFVRVQTRKDDVTNFLNLYFWLEMDNGSSSNGRNAEKRTGHPGYIREVMKNQ